MDYEVWLESFKSRVNADSVLRREFSDYQCNYLPGELQKRLPRFYNRLVVEEGWRHQDFERALVGIVCQRMKLRPAVFERCLRDPALQKPNPRYAKKPKKPSPSSRRWREKNLRSGTIKEFSS